MKVLLCQSYTGSKEPLVFPIGLAYIASTLGKHDTMCWDPNVSPQNYIARFTKLIEEFEPDVVGLSLRNIDNPMTPHGSYYSYSVSMMRKLKEIHPSCKLIVGGAGFSIFAEEIMRLNQEIDFGVFSEGEQTFPELLDNLEHPERVLGVYVRKGKNVTFTGRRAHIDFASLPPPSRNIFDMSKYGGEASIGIQTKRGCKFNCIYCVHRHYMGSHYRMRTPEQVVDEMEAIFHQYDISRFYFADPVFNFPPTHGREICREIIRRRLDFSWEASFRPDYLNKNYMLEALNAGCTLFDFSPDGATDNSLKILGKNLDVNSIRKSIKWSSEIEGAKVAYEFITDVPLYNNEHIHGLMCLVPKILCTCREKVRYLSFSKMRIYPNTKLYSIALEEGKLSETTNLLRSVHYENKSRARETIIKMLRIISYPPFVFNKLQKRLTAKRDVSV